MKKYGLSGNALKFIALITMTVDHIGYILFPSVLWLRIVGRLAMPIYAFLIAEGCRHTKNMAKYFATMVITALFCQVVSFLATGSLYQCILVTFSLSIGIFWLFSYGRTKSLPVQVGLLFLGLAVAFFLTELLPLLLPGTDYGVDYGIHGVVLPLAFLVGQKLHRRLLWGSLVLLLYCLSAGTIQYFCLLALPLLALYNGQRGKWKLKQFFYLYYPAHLGILHLLHTALFA
ncbi:MAG: hypothetical protein IKU07_05615 [Oscillospiraceae bacterium]|nr:hypothetical protein [Oscillospiraceae bacterium]